MMSRYTVLWTYKRGTKQNVGWEREGFLGSDTWRLSRSRSLPGRDGFQAEDIQRVKASRQEGWHLPRSKPILVWRAPRRRNGKFAFIQENEPFSGLPDNTKATQCIFKQEHS